MKVVICTPTLTKPHERYLAALEASVPALDAAGIEHQTVFEVGCPYISHARAAMTRKALDAKADVIVYIDHDVEWEPQDLLRLIQVDEPVVAGLYRFKKDDEEYMGTVRTDGEGRPIVRADGLVNADWVPAGFLKVTRAAINTIMTEYPELMYGEKSSPCIDLFNHGAHNGTWYGEDYAFSRRWNERCGLIWIVPDLNLTHHSAERGYPGNWHNFMRRQPGGSESSTPIPPTSLADRVRQLQEAA